MRRALVLGLTIVALSITVSSQSTNNKAGSKDKPEDQSSPPSAIINPASIDFKDQVAKRASKPLRVTVTNSGGKPLYVNSAVVDGDNKEDFVISNDTCTGATVGANKSCVIDVVFTPSVSERRRAVLAITDNAIGSPQRVTLTGNGINSADVPPR
ncbi:MAG: choice-of-anchor D domain-containing protein [Blastocatellia bacterium]